MWVCQPVLLSFKSHSVVEALDALPPGHQSHELAEVFAKESLKQKALQQVPSDSSPPITKRHYVSVTAELILSPAVSYPLWPYIACLTVFLQRLTLGTAAAVHAVPSNWPFPTELVLKILEDVLPQDQWSIAQVSCLSRELVAPVYLHSLGLQFDDESLWVTIQAIVLYWRKELQFQYALKRPAECHQVDQILSACCRHPSITGIDGIICIWGWYWS